MKIIADENIIYAKEVFTLFGNVELLPGREINNKTLRDADILMIRSVTNVNSELLQNTNVKFVGTATIGTDHIDLDYLKKKNIQFTSAKGCNSFAVAEYVFASIFETCKTENIDLNNQTIGIVGHGNIGTIVAKYSEALGLKVKLNDPPKQEELDSENYLPLEEVLDSNIVTFHVPLNKEGRFRTTHLLNENNLQRINRGSILINSSRGPILDNSALLKRLSKKNDIYTALDVWENEPDINTQLMKLCKIATPHIAGYSFEGKIKGTKILFDKLNLFLGTNYHWPENLYTKKNEDLTNKYNGSAIEIISQIIIDTQGISVSTQEMINKLCNGITSENFDILRKNYTLRKELSNYICQTENPELKNLLNQFRIKT